MRLRASLLLVLLVAGRAALAQPPVVFAAASLKNALDEVAALSPAKPVVSYGASSALAKQIEAGAPAQVFISADLDWADYLEARKLLRAGTRRNILGNRLVLVAPALAQSLPSQKITSGKPQRPLRSRSTWAKPRSASGAEATKRPRASSISAGG